MSSASPNQKSKFLEYFVANAPRLAKEAKLVGDILLVEKVKFPEKRIGGIIIADASRTQLNALTSDQPTFYRVLLVGQGYYDDDTGEDSPLDIKQGDIILTGSVSVKMFSSFPMLEVADSDVFGITRHADVQWQFESEEAFFQFLNSLNEAAKAKVESGRT